MCVVDDTMLRRGMVKSNDLSHLEVVIADSLICDIAVEHLFPTQDPVNFLLVRGKVIN
jgi:hypothetical protein